ncbi:hypothetical protein [Streptomyces sp. NPDC001056]
MRASELAITAVRVMTGGAPATAERRAAVRELVRGRLGGDPLGASALARLDEQPGEGPEGIVASVLNDALRADPDFAALLARALQAPQSPPPPAQPPNPAQPATRPRATTGPPPGHPPAPAAMPAGARVQVPAAADVRKIVLLGFPQMMLAYTLLYIATQNGAGSGIAILVLLVSAGLTGYGIWLGIDLLRQHIRSGALVAAVVFDMLVLLRVLLWLLDTARN